MVASFLALAKSIYYTMVRFRTFGLKSHPIAKFEENRIIRKKRCYILVK